MAKWMITTRARVGRPVPGGAAQRIGTAAAAARQLVVVATRDGSIGVTVASSALDPLEELRAVTERLAAALAADGFVVEGWEVGEYLSEAEADRRLSEASIPPMVPVEQFARMCGVSVQRIYELETERRAAAAEGREHALPAPVVPGWWLRSAAEHYAANRRRRPGRPRKSEA